MEFFHHVTGDSWELFKNPLLVSPVGLIGAIVLCRVGSGMGLDRLFWNDRASIRWKSGIAVALLLATVIFVGFLLRGNPSPSSSALDQLLCFGLVNVARVAVLAGVAILIGHLRAEKTEQSSEVRETLDGPSPLKRSDWQLPAGFAVTLVVLAIGVKLSSYLTTELFGQVNALTSHIRSLGRTDYIYWIHRILNLPPASDPTIGLHVLAAIVAIGNTGYWLWRLVLGPSRGTPSVALCSLGCAIVLIGGKLQFDHISLWVPATFFAVFGLIAAVILGPYTLRVANMSYKRADIHPLDEAGAMPGKPPLNFTGHHFQDRVGDSVLRPLVIVCCSGGGIRAGIWTIRTLINLHQLKAGADSDGPKLLPDFEHRLRLVFGASGGMLGAVRYVTWLRDNQAGDQNQFTSSDVAIAQVEADGLSQLASQLIFHDVPKSVLPFIWGKHRGEVIEDNWRTNFEWEAHQTFGTIRGAELQGKIPSIVLSPMMIEDGRRLLISNLDLTPVTQCHGNEIKGDSIQQLYSQSSIAFRQLFGESVANGLRLLSAVRMNASFPFVMPASSIPTLPRRRVVDAGYYDNFGVGLAADWLEYTINDPERNKWLRNNASGVLVIQIRDGVLDLTKPVSSKLGPKPNVLLQFLEPLTAPIQALLGFKTAVQLFDNDSRLSRILDLINKNFGDADFATSASFELGSEASLTWALAEDEKLRLAAASNNSKFRERVEAISKWWNMRSIPR